MEDASGFGRVLPYQPSEALLAEARLKLHVRATYGKNGPVVKNPRTDPLARTPLHWAAHKGEMKWVEEHLTSRNINSMDFFGQTPLYHAAMMGHKDAAEAPLKAGADKDAPDPDGCTPMWFAADEGHVAVVEGLLEAGADKDMPDAEGVTPLQCAVSRGDTAVAEVLRKAGAV